MLPFASGSSFVLAADGTFVLRFPPREHTGWWFPGVEYKGRFTESAGMLSFDFDWNNTKAGATAVFQGDDMTVTYGDYMSMSDFPNGVYRLER
jgi:hypothetical protein